MSWVVHATTCALVMMRLPSMRKPVPEARCGRSKIQGADQFGSWYEVKICTTDFSGSEPSGSGVPRGGAELAIGAGAVCGGAMAAGSALLAPGELPGRAAPLGTEGGTAGVPGFPAPAGGLRTVGVAAGSGRGDEASASPMRQRPAQRRDNM